MKKLGYKVNLKTVDAFVKKWKQDGSVQDRHRGNSGQKKINSQSKKKQFTYRCRQQDVSQKACICFMYSKISLHRTRKRDFGLRPYKTQTSQELKEDDDINRLAFFNKIEKKNNAEC